MKDKVHEKIQALFIEYTKNLPNKIQSLESQWNQITQQWDPEKFQTFHRDVHSLCGSAGTYGYPVLSQVARDLEVYLKALLDKESIENKDREKISVLLKTIKENASVSGTIQFSNLNESNTISSKQNKNIYCFLKKDNFVALLDDYIQESGYVCHLVSNLSELKNVIQNNKAGGLIIDIDIVEEVFKKELKNMNIEIPLICISNKSDILTRLESIRVGSSAFFSKPFDPFYLVKILNELSDVSNAPYRILIVDDSVSLSEYYSLILQEAGMQTRAITNPLELMSTLADFEPDLLLMDIYMPECTGLELAILLRQESAYASIPIVFLSTEADKFKQLSALKLGGDDFLTKPVVPQHLVETIKSRAKRASILNAYMTTDSLTGLLNHANFLQRLEMEISRAIRQNTPFSLIMLDIDNFKKVNDSYGHLAGDKVLKKLAAFLLTNLRKIDSIGRYGGEEFIAVFPNTEIEKSVMICERLRKDFSHLIFYINDSKFQVTFSVGIANYPTFKDKNSLIAAADNALYQAKHNGRNQVCYKK